MAQTRRYKKAEKNFVFSILNSCKQFFSAIGRFFLFIFKAGNRKLTIMLVPHSQKKVLNFQTSIFALIILLIILSGLTLSFVFYNKQSFIASRELSLLRDENKKTKASLDELRDESTNLMQTAKRFQASLSQSLSILGINQTTKNQGSGTSSDLASLFDLQEISQGSLQEVAEIKQLTAYLENSIQPLEQIAKMLELQGSLFADIPSVWPLQGGIGHISMAFGQNKHPITGQWYIHKGLDFSTWRSGDPIIATANGQVVTADYSQDFGYYVVIKHKHGFYTRYAHMSVIRARKGQFVSQGDVIGNVGNTGLSTAAHLHYEVHIGDGVVDPAKYVYVKLAK